VEGGGEVALPFLNPIVAPSKNIKYIRINNVFIYNAPLIFGLPYLKIWSDYKFFDKIIIQFFFHFDEAKVPERSNLLPETTIKEET